MHQKAYGKVISFIEGQQLVYASQCAAGNGNFQVTNGIRAGSCRPQRSCDYSSIIYKKKTRAITAGQCQLNSHLNEEEITGFRTEEIDIIQTPDILGTYRYQKLSRLSTHHSARGTVSNSERAPWTG